MSEITAKSIIERIKKARKWFLVGTAQSAHQTEGDNTNDWTVFESKPGNIANEDKSGKAANHYEMYEEDFKILEDLGFHMHRLSIEWSRIMPEPGKIDLEEIEHYRKVLRSLRAHNQISFVTLHHFTIPIWFLEMGGFLHKKNLPYFDEFVEIVCEHLGDEIDVFNTINEPMIYASTGYLMGNHSPGETSVIKYMKVANNLIRAHFNAVKIIRKYHPDKPVGIVKNLMHIRPYRKWSPIDRLIAWVSDHFFGRAATRALKKGTIPFGFGRAGKDVGDFVGVNYYIHMEMGLGLPGMMVYHSKDVDRLTQTGWGTAPEGMYKEIKRIYNKLKLPIYVTENGIATDDDEWRIQFILQHLDVVARLIEEGVDIRGYFYWSYIDNFEWADGFHPKFGLIEYDPETFERKLKPSAKFLGDIAKAFEIDFQNLELC